MRFIITNAHVNNVGSAKKKNFLKIGMKFLDFKNQIGFVLKIQHFFY